MPNSTWNFTNPNTDENAEGADGRWRTYDPTRWGGHGDDMEYGPDGVLRYKHGTSDAEIDASRYRAMADNPTVAAGYTNGPRIGGDDDAVRGVQDDAVGVARDAALGNGTSAAIAAGRNAAVGAQRAQMSMAGTMRGGPRMQAAAMRMGQQNAGDIQARQAMQEQATRAAEMAAGRNAWSQISNQQHQQDVNRGISQAQLDAQQRAQNEQSSEYYDRLGWETRNADMGQRLGRTAADQAAANASRATGLQEQQQAWANTKEGLGIGAGGVSGGISAYERSQQPKPDDPYDTSDKRAKVDIMPVQRISDAVAKSLEQRGAGLRATMDAARGLPAATSPREPARYAGGIYRDAYSEPYHAPPSKPIGTSALHAAIEQRIAQDEPTRNKGPDPERAIAAPVQGGMAYTHRGYARELMGRPEAYYGAFDSGAGTGREDEDAGLAPGTSDFAAASGRKPDRYSSAIMRSDARAKAEAWDEGHQAALADVQKWSQQPAENLKDAKSPIAQTVRNLKADAWDEGHGVTPPEPPLPPFHVQPQIPWNFDAPKQQAQTVAAAQRAADAFVPLQHVPTTGDKLASAVAKASNGIEDNVGDMAMKAAPNLPGRLEGTHAGQRIAEKLRVLQDEEALKNYAATMRSDKSSKVLADGESMHDKAPNEIAFKPKPGQAKANSTGFSNALSKIRARAASLEQDDAMTSDERAKEPAKGDDAMADALRSMKPSAYRYKPGMGPPTQHEGDVNVGPMAQNMAANPVARTAIVVEPDTGLLAIDKEKALKLSMGGLADLQHQIDDLKKRRSA